MKHSPIFNAVAYVDGLGIEGMSPAQLLQVIKLLADDRLTKAHFDYYNDRLQAVSILASKALEKVEDD